MITQAQRDHGAHLMSWLEENRAKIGYGQRRPMLDERLTEQNLDIAFRASQADGTKVISPDCSEMLSMICHMAGLQDPSGEGYDSYGNTETMYHHLPHYHDFQHAHPMSIICFGAGGSAPVSRHHVAMVYQRAPDPMLFSHGSSSGPGFIKLSWLAAAVPGPVTGLDVSHL